MKTALDKARSRFPCHALVKCVVQNFEEKAKTDTTTARCSICGLQVHDWVDPDWAHGRICRSCESRHEPREEKAK